MTSFEPRLPRAVEADPRCDALRRWLVEHARPLRDGGEWRVAWAPLTGALAAALRSARSTGRLVRGLESIAPTLEAEARGQRLADERLAVERGDAPRAARISRLLVLSNDGADRFHRQVESLLRRHGDRVLALRVDASAEELGALLFGPGHLARAVLIEHRDAVATALLALVPAATASAGPGLDAVELEPRG